MLSSFSLNNLFKVNWCVNYSINSNGQIFVEQNEREGNRIIDLNNEYTDMLRQMKGRSLFRPITTSKFLAYFIEDDKHLEVHVLDLEDKSISIFKEKLDRNLYSLIPYDNEYLFDVIINEQGKKELVIKHYRNKDIIKTLFEVPNGNSINTLKVDVSIQKDILFFLKHQESMNFDLYIYNSNDGIYHKVFNSSKTVFPLSAKWSPNGKYISCLYREVSTLKIVIIDIEKEETIFIDTPSIKEEPVWYEDNERLLLSVEEWPYTNLYVYELKNKRIHLLDIDFKGVISQPKWYKNELYFIANNPNTPSSLVKWDPTKNIIKKITSNHFDFLPVTEEVVNIPSSEGFEIPCLFYKSRFQSDSSIVILHGGPSGSWVANWSPFIHLLVNEGYNVLLVNPRGSTIRSKPLPLMSKGDFGVKDCSDVLTCINWLVENEYGKKGTISLYGHSYGGFLAYQTAKISKEYISSIIITSGYLEAIALLKSKNSSVIRFATIAFLEEQLENKKEWIDCPILHIHGRNDTQIPVEIVREILYNIPYNRNKFTELPNEGHAFKKKENMVLWMKEALNFIRKHKGITSNSL